MDKRMTVLRGCVLVLVLVLAVSGCETLRRKFTRRKRRKTAQEEMVVVPRDYSEHPFPNDVLYVQYFTYWKAWNQEWVARLSERGAHKKIVSCGEQTLVNLEKMRTYLTDEKQKELDTSIEKTRALLEEIEAHTSLLPSQYSGYRYRADRILSTVNRRFDMRHVKGAIR